MGVNIEQHDIRTNACCTSVVLVAAICGALVQRAPCMIRQVSGPPKRANRLRQVGVSAVCCDLPKGAGRRRSQSLLATKEHDVSVVVAGYILVCFCAFPDAETSHFAPHLRPATAATLRLSPSFGMSQSASTDARFFHKRYRVR